MSALESVFWVPQCVHTLSIKFKGGINSKPMPTMKMTIMVIQASLSSLDTYYQLQYHQVQWSHFYAGSESWWTRQEHPISTNFFCSRCTRCTKRWRIKPLLSTSNSAVKHWIIKMKLPIATLLPRSTAAFTPAQQRKASTTLNLNELEISVTTPLRPS